MMAAGKAATADGSVMVARSQDALGDYAQQVQAVSRKNHTPEETLKFIKPEGVEIPQVRETYAYLAIVGVLEGEEISQANGGINEYQVCAGASTGGFLNRKAEETCPKMPTSLGDYRCTLVLERCRTAREGIRLIGELTIILLRTRTKLGSTRNIKENYGMQSGSLTTVLLYRPTQSELIE